MVEHQSLKLIIETCASQIVQKLRMHSWTLFQGLSQHCNRRFYAEK